ncbi:MAG: class I SAM-dependent rRNA methyltransferase [candidate division Zixibacteria bacterium]|nr:class I SAM-dependent rRNA methyltransferase [candidate division Zixibacteria bacterium]MDD5427267.1 class I SAM-dependent rRNA methyltransferase [candidate division Zixibacteria bacterium]
MADIILKKERDKTARRYHPWVYSGAIDKVVDPVEAGDTVTVRDSRKEFIAYGFYNPRSQIAVRLTEWNEKLLPDDRWWYEKIRQAVANRQRYVTAPDMTDAVRMVFSEADFLPGLIVDKYADYLVVQFLTAGAEKMKPLVAASLNELIHPAGIYERSDVDVRLIEGLDKNKGVLSGPEPPDKVLIRENGLPFMVDIKNGHKTGFYLDQRDNRRLVSAYAAKREILDCFAYTGAFSSYLLKGGAKTVTLLEASSECLHLARENIALNCPEKTTVDFLEGDAFDRLRYLCETGRRFDMVVLDPPKFAVTPGHLKKALAAYKDINLQAMKILSPGGILATFSCSGLVSEESFQLALFWAATDARRQVQYLHLLTHPADHPVLASFPEGRYLKGCLCRVV